MTDTVDTPLPTVAPRIPLVDLRGRTPVDLLRDHEQTARVLVYNATNTLGIASRLVSKVILPLADRKSRDWLERSNSPYLHEIDAMAQILGTPGTYALNLSYEWGCTTGAFATADSVTLMRLLDWPFPAIGTHIMVIHQSSEAGEFYNVGWPGMSGMLTGMAPGRFAAALNQAPMRKHSQFQPDVLTMPFDWVKNRFLVNRAEGMPPPHLLRKVFEQATDYASAREMLMRTPVTLPVIFILAGMRPQEGCVIERTESDAAVRELGVSDRVTVANHFSTALNELGSGWRPRTGDSRARLLQSMSVPVANLGRADFSWLEAPMLNEDTRLGVLADAATGRLMVQGLEGERRTTQVFNLGDDR